MGAKGSLLRLAYNSVRAGESSAAPRWDSKAKRFALSGVFELAEFKKIKSEGAERCFIASEDQRKTCGAQEDV